MPVYFGIDPPHTQRGNATRVSEALERKGIKLVRAAPSDISILCFPEIVTAVFGLISSFFYVLIRALAKKETVPLNNGIFEVTESHPNPFPINLPPLAVSLKSSNSNGHDVLISNGFEMVVIQGKDLYLNGGITKVQLKAITENPSLDLNRICYAPVGFCNLSSMATALDLIALFSFAAQLLGLGVHGSESGSTDVDDYDEVPGDEMTIDADDTSFQARIFNEGTDFTRMFLKKASTRVVTPAGIDIRECFFTPDEVSGKYSGFLFRYIRELAIDDQKTVPSFVQRYMLRNLGSSIEECSDNFAVLSSSWGNLRDTTFGHELTHIAKCLLVTLELNASVYPLFDSGFYEGCVIRCKDSSISIQGKVVESCTPEQLATEVQHIATHKRTLDQIAVLAVREGALAALADRIRASSSMVELRSLLMATPISEATKEGILSVAPYLRFPARSWSINAQSMEALCSISESLSNLKFEHPISFRGLLTNDSVEVAMSCFDDRRCPSLLSPSGTAIDLKGRVPGPPQQGNSSGDRSKGKQRVSDAAWTFTIRRAPFEEAVSDLKKVIYNAEARSISSSAARGTGAVVFRKKQFSDLFGQLQKLIAARGRTGPTVITALESNRTIGGGSSESQGPGGERAAKRMRF